MNTRVDDSCIHVRISEPYTWRGVRGGLRTLRHLKIETHYGYVSYGAEDSKGRLRWYGERQWWRWIETAQAVGPAEEVA